MNNRLTVEVHHRLNPLSAEEWTRLFHSSPNTAAMAELFDLVGLGGFKLHSILVRLDGAPILLLPLFQTIHNLAATMNGGLRNFVHKIDRLFPWLLRLNLLRVGIVDQQFGQVGYDPDVDLLHLDAAWNLALPALERLCASLKIKLVAFSEFTSESGRMLPVHKMAEYCLAESAPFCQLQVKFDSVDDFLKQMPKDMRHFLRRSIRKSQDLEMMATRDPAPWLDEIYRLYLGQVERSDLNLNGTLCKNYFARVCEIDPAAHYVLYSLNGRLVSYELFVVQNDCIISKQIGVDPELGRVHNVYFRSWMDLIRYCIEKQIKLVDLGCTHEKLKAEMGAGHLVPSVILVKHRNPLFNYLLHRFKSYLAYDSEISVDKAEVGTGWNEYIRWAGKRVIKERESIREPELHR